MIAPTPLHRVPAIPLTRMDNADPALMEELLDVVERLARSAMFVGGAEVDAFEEEFAAYCGTDHAVGLSSGTEALALALRALEVGVGDEVIVPTNSFIATAEAVTLVGATPRFIDVDPDTALVTAELIEPALTPRTRCVIPVHLYGRTVDLDPIVALARDTGIAVIEDACQAHGAWLNGRRAGSVGDCGCFSFYPAKNLGAWGDGGGLVTSDPEIADRVRLLRSHGERPRYNHRIPGTTARLDAMHAAILRVKLRRLDEANDGRRRVAGALTAALRGAAVTAPAAVADGGDHVYHQFVVTMDAREKVREHLATQGIATAVHYPVPIHRSEAYASLIRNRRPLPVAESLAGRICSLPMHPAMADEEIGRVAAVIHEMQVLAQAA
jgi:dTDP-3-amino-3,4,6-trideoxy-alpha-D-glucose transaminase